MACFVWWRHNVCIFCLLLSFSFLFADERDGVSTRITYYLLLVETSSLLQVRHLTFIMSRNLSFRNSVIISPLLISHVLSSFSHATIHFAGSKPPSCSKYKPHSAFPHTPNLPSQPTPSILQAQQKNKRREYLFICFFLHLP